MMKLSVTRLSKALFLSTTLAASALSATSVTSDPVGAIRYDFNTNADANIGLSLARPSAFEGRIASVDLANSTVTFEGNPGWAVDQFIENAESHYLYIKSGDEEGMHVTVTGNTANSITVFLDTGDRLDRLVVGEVASVVPYWTLDTFFQGKASENLNVFFCRVRNYADATFHPIHVRFISGEWRKVGDNSLLGDMAIYPGEILLVRNYGEPFSIDVTGTIPMAAARIVFRSSVVIARPKEQRISFFTATTIPINTVTAMTDNDLITSFNNTGVNLNDQQVFFFWGDWYDQRTYQIRNNDYWIEPGRGYSYNGFQNRESIASVLTVAQPYLD